MAASQAVIVMLQMMLGNEEWFASVQPGAAGGTQETASAESGGGWMQMVRSGKIRYLQYRCGGPMYNLLLGTTRMSCSIFWQRSRNGRCKRQGFVT